MKKIEIFIFTLIILVVNLPLFTGGSIEMMTYSIEPEASGQYWRLLTHPFAHNSIYHMGIDSLAFLSLYWQLGEKSPAKRLLYVFFCGIISLIAIDYQLREMAVNTYCGLSGIDHGLMVIVGLEMVYGNKQLRNAGLIITTIIIGKGIIENIAGGLLFESAHLGYVGIPIIMSHTGGIIGGVLIYYIANCRIKNHSRSEIIRLQRN